MTKRIQTKQKLVYLTEKQIEFLELLAYNGATNVSQVLRQLIDKTIKETDKNN
jgi:hypothetical protein